MISNHRKLICTIFFSFFLSLLQGSLGDFLRLRPHVSGYLWIRKFFFPHAPSVHTFAENSLPNVRDRRGGGLVGPRPHHFFAPPPPLFALKRKIIKKKKTWNKFFFPSIFRYILCIFFNFKRQAFCGAPVLFTVIVPGADLPLDQTPCLGHPFASFGSVFRTSSSGRVFCQFYSFFRFSIWKNYF